MYAFVFCVLLSNTLYYLGSQAKITEFMWSRFPTWLDSYMQCSACSGFLYGVLTGWLFVIGLKMSYLNLGTDWYTPLVVGAVSITTTPLMAYLHISALRRLGSPWDMAAPTEVATSEPAENG